MTCRGLRSTRAGSRGRATIGIVAASEVGGTLGSNCPAWGGTTFCEQAFSYGCATTLRRPCAEIAVLQTSVVARRSRRTRRSGGSGRRGHSTGHATVRQRRSTRSTHRATVRQRRSARSTRRATILWGRSPRRPGAPQRCGGIAGARSGHGRATCSRNTKASATSSAPTAVLASNPTSIWIGGSSVGG